MLPKPDLTFYLRLDAEQAFERLKKRWKEKGEGGSDPEIFEKLELQKQFVFHYDAFCGRIHDNEEMAKQVIIIDASKSIEEVHHDILRHAKAHLESKGLLNGQ